MRLRRIEAARFGRLIDTSLAPLGDGLTVVLGPNEAGKSSFTALVRYILYGFPTEKDISERPYLSDAGQREGRLLFESAEGEWVVERTAGVRGGPAAVRAVRGSERPELLDELTAGVSKQAFRVVFGFGLAEMAQIESLRGTDDDIISRLYAAGAGLRVSPQEVRAAIEAEAADLYRPRGSKPAINTLIARSRELHREIAELEAAASALVSDHERLDEVAVALEEAKGRFDTSVTAHRRLAEEARALGDLEEGIRSSEGELVTLRREARELADRAASFTVDTEVLARATSIDSLAEDLSGYRRALADLKDAESKAEALGAELGARLEEAGLDRQDASKVDASPETRTGVDRWSERLSSAEKGALMAAEVRDRAADEAAAALVDLPRAQGAPDPGSRLDVVAWVIVALFGVALVGAGWFVAQWPVAAAGAVLAAFGLVMALRSAGSSDHRGPDVARQADRATDLARRAEQERLAAGRALQEAESAREEWRAWLADRGLPAVTEPAAAARVLELLTESRRIEQRHAEETARAQRERAEIEAYLDRIREVGTPLGVAAPSTPAEAPATIARLRELLGEVRATAAGGESSAEEASSAAARLADAEARQARAIDRAQELIERVGVEGGFAELSALVERAEIDASASRDQWAALGKEMSALETRVDAREREDMMGAARLELESMRERIAGHAERYATLSLAARLVARAQERYDRERQPIVVKEAERIFETITGGAYERLTIPLGSSSIEVFDAAARSKDTARLSTGTAEQLYLALRLALIGQLTEKGAALPVLMDDVFANFDPERKRGAAAAVAELARHRQVIVFTCHPETVGILEEADPGLTRLSLDRC